MFIINKYSIVSEEDEPVLIWPCDQVPYAVGLAVDKRGLIYVGGAKNKTSYILSAEGKYNTIKITTIINSIRIMINHDILLLRNMWSMSCIYCCILETIPFGSCHS